MIGTKEHKCEYSGVIVTRDAVRHFRNAWCTICGKAEEQSRMDVAGSLWIMGTDGTEEQEEKEQVKP